jgi:hypothetical protein
MGFKFDDDDNELSLDIGGDTAKTQKPAPLPPTVVANEEVAEDKPSIPTKPKTVESNAEVLKNLPRPGQAVSKPNKEDDDLTSLLDDSEEEAPKANRVEALVEAEEVVAQPEAESTLNVTPPVVSSGRRKVVPIEEPIAFDSQAILTIEETNETLVKSKSNPFAGARKKVMQIRIAAAVVALFLILSGVWSFVPKAGFSGDENAQQLSIDNGNQYESIRQASESYALKLMTDLINRPDPSYEKTLGERLVTYMSDAQAQTLTSNFRLNSYPTVGNADGKLYQKVLNGPFVDNQELVKIANLSRIDTDNDGYNESFIYPIRVAAFVQYVTDPTEAKSAGDGVPTLSSRWVYYVVPVIHNYKNKSTFLYGYPSVAGALPIDNFKDYEKGSESPWSSTDKELSQNGLLKTAVIDFLTAWAAQTPQSDVANVSNSLLNLLSPSTDKSSPLYPTYRVAQGLSGAYSLKPSGKEGEPPFITVDIEGLPESEVPTAETIRKAVVTVEWKDNILGASAGTPSYITQQYIITFIGVEKWYFIDIKPRYSE